MTVHGHPIQAAIRPIDTNPAGTIRRRRDNIARAADRHAELWGFYDQIPEVHFWVNTTSGIVRMIDFYPAIEPSDTDLTEPEPDTDQQVLDVWKSVGGESRIRELVAEFAAHRRVTGEGYLVPRGADSGQLIVPVGDGVTYLRPGTGDPNVGDEDTVWDVVSAVELRKLANLDAGGTINDDLPIWRVWRRHLADNEKADSPLYAVRTQCLALIALDGRVLADARSRLSAGIHLFPSSLRSVKTEDGDSFEKMLDDVLLTPIYDPQSTDAIVPAIAYVEREEIDAHKAITFGRSNIEEDIKQREELVRRIAAGMDAPAELMLGVGDLNHWSAWLVTDTTYTQHIDPDVVAILDDLSVWWRNLLDSQGIDTEGRSLWRNPANALRRTDPLADMERLYDRFLVKGETLRNTVGVGEQDAPSDEEIEQRIRIAQISTPLAISQGVGNSLDPSDDPIPGLPATSNPADTAPVIQAASAPLDDLAGDLSEIDRELLAALTDEAERQIQDVAGQAIEAIEATVATDPEFGASLTWDKLTPEEIESVAGPDAGIIPTMFDAAAIAALVTEAEASRLRTLGQDPEPDTNDLTDGINLILAAILATTIRAVLGAGIDPDRLGESSPSPLAAPVADIRDGLTVAGGGRNLDDPTIDLLANGQRTIDQLAAQGLVTTGYQWVYGEAARRSTFRPHRRMDGRSFDDFDDPTLAPPPEAAFVGDRMYPGDHRGCRCTYRRILELSEPFPVPVG